MYSAEGDTSMRQAFSEPAKNDPRCELRLGVASWDDGSGAVQSVKYTWFDRNGKAARGGEFPVEALPQALDFAIRKGYVSLNPPFPRLPSPVICRKDVSQQSSEMMLVCTAISPQLTY
jgi:hypothetical protein